MGSTLQVEKKKILIVDDEYITAMNLMDILNKSGYSVVDTVGSGKDAIERTAELDPDLILLDIVLNDKMDGIECAVKIHEFNKVPIIFITAYSDDEIVSRAKMAEPYGYIIKPFNKSELRTIVTLALHRYSLEKRLTDSLADLKKTLNGTVQAIAKIIEVRDPYTAGHQRRVGFLARAIASELDLDDNIVESVFIGGSIHDIGKISIPAEILSKPSKLNNSEFQLIMNHPNTGFEILNEIEFPQLIVDIVYNHHERLDGSGYPRGLTGKNMDLGAKIVSIADVVEAMGSHRPYRASLGVDAALNEILTNPQKYDSGLSRVCSDLFREGGFSLSSYN